VELNHVVMAVDQATYDAVVASPFLRDVFANGGVQTVVVDPDESWTGRYVMGERLYLEVFGPGGREGREPGFVALAFSTRSAGDIDRIESRLRQLVGNRAHRLLRTRQVGSETRPWFHAVSVDPPSFDRRAGAWVMEYPGGHLRGLGLEEDRMPAREDYLAALRRARGQSDPPPSRLLEDVTGIDLRLAEGEAADLAALLLASGWTRATTGDRQFALRGAGLVLRVTLDPAPDPRLRAIEFSLRRSPDAERRVELSDHSRLTVRTDGTARWVFDAGH
jgi:hypothetical protein